MLKLGSNHELTERNQDWNKEDRLTRSIKLTFPELVSHFAVPENIHTCPKEGYWVIPRDEGVGGGVNKIIKTRVVKYLKPNNFPWRSMEHTISNLPHVLGIICKIIAHYTAYHKPRVVKRSRIYSHREVQHMPIYFSLVMLYTMLHHGPKLWPQWTLVDLWLFPRASEGLVMQRLGFQSHFSEGQYGLKVYAVPCVLLFNSLDKKLYSTLLCFPRHMTV